METIRIAEVIVNVVLQGWGSWLQGMMRTITELGGQMVFFMIIPAIYWCIDALAGLRVGCVLLLSGSFNHFFKVLLKGPRPYWIDSRVIPLIHESSFGMPSGHSMNSASVWGWLAVEARSKRTTLVFLLVVFLVGVSRLVLGVHFLSDVLIGWLLGALLVLAFWRFAPKVADRVRNRSWQSQALLAFVSSLGMIGLSLAARSIPAGWQMPAEWLERAGDVDPLSLDGVLTTSGMWFGMLGGFVFLRAKKGILQSGAGKGKRVLRYVLGLAGLFALYAGLGALFPQDLGSLSAVLRYLRYGLIGLWISCLSPLVFEKLGIGEIRQHED